MTTLRHRSRILGAALLLPMLAATVACGQTDGPADADTITIGYVNNEGGVLSLPEFRIGGEVAVTAVNDAGGVNGRKMKLVSCLTDGSPEGSINCANRLIDERVAIAYTGIDISSDAAVPLYERAKIPYVSSNAWGTRQRTSRVAHLLHTAPSSYIVGPMRVLKEMGARKVVVMTEQSSDANRMMDTLVTPVARQTGMEFTPVLVDPQSPDWTQVAAAALAGNPDGVVAQLTEENCVAMVAAFRAAGYDRPIMAGACTAFVAALGERAVGAYVFTDLYAPETKRFAPPDIQQNLGLYEDAMRRAGQDKYLDGFAVAPFSAMFELRDILRTVPAGEPVDSAAVSEAFAAAKTSPGFLGSTLHCGEPPYLTEPASCRADLLVFKVTRGADGKVGKEPAVPGFQTYRF